MPLITNNISSTNEYDIVETYGIAQREILLRSSHLRSGEVSSFLPGTGIFYLLWTMLKQVRTNSAFNIVSLHLTPYAHCSLNIEIFHLLTGHIPLCEAFWTTILEIELKPTMHSAHALDGFCMYFFRFSTWRKLIRVAATK